jgi:hypothetical protein
VLAKATHDMLGKLLAREVCEFNTFGDVRVCFDWDTAEIRRDMKNRRGEWIEVGNQ